MKFFKLILFGLLLFAAMKLDAQVVDSFAGKQAAEPLNQMDAGGRRTGLWLIYHAEHMDEPAFYEFGHFDVGRKTGMWYKVDKEESLVASENYKNDVLNGEVRYFDHGLLLCIGHYRGLNTSALFDTIAVMDPVTDTFVTRIIASDRGTLKHGVWKYYDEHNGRLVREEEYQVDSLIYHKEFSAIRESDEDPKELEKKRPHNKILKYKPPVGKSYSYLKQD